ncbi:MAG: SurA N-terminal domain-containing protein [Synergistaceae bacterium]|nr:SurA N-terminal domain-containing protein [Synergistaceae bacterium]
MNKLRNHVKWILWVIVVAFLASTFFMYETGRGGGSGGLEDYAAAEVNGRPLMRSALDQRVRLLLAESGGRDMASIDLYLPYLYQTALNQYAMERQMEQEVRDSGITVSDAEADQVMKEYADQAFPTREAFYQYLERRGEKLEDYRRNIARQMASERLLQQSVGPVNVGGDEAREFYENMKAFAFRQPAGFNVNLARFSSEAGAERFRGLLLGGVEWADAASGDVVSADRVTASYFPESVFDGALSPLKSLDLGVVSPVFEPSSGDFTVGIKREAVEEKFTPYDEVSADVSAWLIQQKKREVINEFTQGLLTRAKIVIHDKTLFPSESPELLPVAVSADVNGDS